MNLGSGKNISIHLTMRDLPDQLQPSISLSLYRIAQETMHNVIIHSKAKNVQVELGADDRRISLRIIDDGVGFDPVAKQEGWGSKACDNESRQ